MASFLTSWLVVWIGLALAACVATWIWIGSQSPTKFARGYIAFRFKEKELPAGDSYGLLFDDLAALACERAQLVQAVEEKGLRQLIHDESDAMLFIAEQWYCGNDFMISDEVFRPVVELLREYAYERRT